MSQSLSVCVKGLKTIEQKVEESDEKLSYLSRLGATIKCVQKDVNLLLTQKIEEEKKCGGPVQDEIEVETEEGLTDEEEEDAISETTPSQSKRLKSC